MIHSYVNMSGCTLLRTKAQKCPLFLSSLGSCVGSLLFQNHILHVSQISQWPAPTRHCLGHYGDHSGQGRDLRLRQTLVQMMLFAGLGGSYWAVCIAELWKKAAQLPSLLGRCGHRLRLCVSLLCCLTTEKSNSLKRKFHWKCSLLSINWFYARIGRQKWSKEYFKILITKWYHLYNNFST